MRGWGRTVHPSFAFAPGAQAGARPGTVAKEDVFHVLVRAKFTDALSQFVY